ncbi:UDP-Glycosyltransferase/glycogen phosphorylase [Basidiobolus meristosporus CBS 931.73]|uniref:sterol 3beta-glucosyltransferase n=1 Tax=Basidiobolus meristosporus CBS 931.73 TaxID=1314790 RepID=A0A1Y1XTA0_9FUNG|nr:UDP-Glycosyltransferase/glycogen phosphorylase [Basidiobolus meristosporus CBS 931.73]|eukprot:ORX88736.1 UDP-Glycosyltransferase/glycogen phosphorylase [Basidiobolus meristosporus CBS 931.73]
MYLTDQHICFFASTNRKKLSTTERSGFLHLKTRNIGSFSTFWFVLREGTISYYANSTDIYYPLDVVDLKYVVALKKNDKKNIIQIVTPEKNFIIQADTPMAMNEWIKDIIDVVCTLRNGDGIKLAIALDHVVDVEVTSSFNHHDSLCIRCFENENSVTIDEYYFTYFHDTKHVRDEIYKHLPNVEQPNHRATATLAPNEDEKTSPKSKRLSGLASILSKINFTEGPGEWLSERSTSSSSKTRDPKSPHHDELDGFDLHTGEETQEKGHWWIPTIPTLSKRHRSPEQKEHDLKKLFALPTKERIIKGFKGALLRTLPVRGKIYVSDHHILYKSKVIGNNLKVIIPFEDVHEIHKRVGSMIFPYGIYFLTISQIEILVAFGAESARDEFFELVSSLMGQVKERPGLLRKQSMIFEDELDTHPKRPINGIQSLSYPVFDTNTTIEKPQSIHVTCLTIGTRGDVQPYIALCKGLMKRGHRCRIATHAEYKDWVESHGIEFREVAGDPAELMRLCVDNGMFSISFIREGISKFRGWLDELFVTAWEACQGTDLIIESPSAMAGVHIAEKLDVPFYSCFTMPWTRTRSYPHPFAVPDHHIGGSYNYMTYMLFDQVFWKGTGWQINRWRKKHLGLPSTSPDKMALHRIPFLYCFSAEIVPPAPDWPDWIHLCGYWFLDNPDQSWKPPQSLLDFLNVTPKPVYIGFGSIVVQDPEKMTNIIIEGVRKAGVRAIVSKGWSSRLQQEGKEPKEKVEFPDFIYSLDSVPHDWLFPQVAGVVHHGGAGTTSAGIRAGVPTVIKPFFGDQFFWGNRVQDMGIGLCLKKLTVEKLAHALQTITTDEKIIKRSQIAGEKVRAENGVENAINYIFRDYELARRRTTKSSGLYELSKSPLALSFEASSDEGEHMEELPVPSPVNHSALRSASDIQ